MLLVTATSPLLLLALLACPLGMGLMMFFMAKGMRGGDTRSTSTKVDSVPELKAEQARLAEKIDALEQARAQGDPAEKEPAETSRVA